MKILVLNSGSSSQKSCLYEIGDALPDDPPACLWQATIEWEGEFGRAEIKNGRGLSKKETIRISSRPGHGAPSGYFVEGRGQPGLITLGN